jgi:hypothetical protein
MKLNSDPSLLLKVYTNFNYCYIQKIVIIYLVSFSIESLIKTYFLKPVNLW